MATVELTLFHERDILVQVNVSAADAQRASTDTAFATQLLNRALNEQPRTSTSADLADENFGKEIIAKVYKRMKYEAENGVEKVTDARWRTSQCCGVSQHTISNILAEEKRAKANMSNTEAPEKIFTSPLKRKRVRPKSNLEDFDLSVLRRTLMSFQREFKQLPTLTKLKQVLSERIGFNGCIETMRTVLRASGYEWVTRGNRKVLVERHKMQMMRYKYLKQLRKYRDEGRYIVYIDESYIHTTLTQNRPWKRLKEVSPQQKPLLKGVRVIIVHAGGCKEFTPDAFLLYKAESPSEDSDDTKNFENYNQWLTDQLLQKLPKNAVIIIDNAYYHNILSEKCPKVNSSKENIQEWLKEKDIPFDESMKRVELYDLVLKYKDRFKSFVIDELIISKGFEVLRIPSYHAELNPIEKIWGILKEYVAEKNVGHKISNIMALIKERIELLDRNMWEATCRQVEETEKQYLQYFDMDDECSINTNDLDLDESNSNDGSCDNRSWDVS